jgi:hypothetical protein
VLALLDKYPVLANYINTVNGELQVSEAGLMEIERLEQMKGARAAS